MNNKNTFGFNPNCLILLATLAGPVLSAGMTEETVQGGYLKVDLSAATFDLPGYKDGFGVVNLAPVSGPFLSKAEDQSGEALSMTAGWITDYPIEQVDGLLFFEGSAFYSRSDESYSTLLGSDSAGNNIRLALFNGSNGFNSNAFNPLSYMLKSELNYFGGNLAVGIQNQAFGWKMRYQLGPQLLRLNQDYKLFGTNPTFSDSTYNRHETLDTDYLGLRLGMSGTRMLGEKLLIEAGVGVAALKMDSDYQGTDVRSTGGGSSLSRGLDERTYGVDLKLALRYALTPSFSIGLNYGLSYLDKVPEIVHATGATGNGTFVPARLETGHMLMQHAGIELSHAF